jgi:hypothetical protein
MSAGPAPETPTDPAADAAPENTASGVEAVEPAPDESEVDEDPGQVALIAALLELERHVREAGWDQPARLFALVLTDELVASEPQLAVSLGLRSSTDGGPVGGLTAIEQDEFVSSGDLLDDLAAVEWPDTVFGCAVAVERTFLPPTAEKDIPDDPAAAVDFVAQHPQRQDVRVLVGVDRSGHRHGVARLVSEPDELLAADNLVPGLVSALAHTLT